jgi:transcriptional regulator with XRE-family HTH domain
MSVSENDWRQSFGLILDKIRKTKGITQLKIAIDTLYDEATVRKVLHGKSGIKLKTLIDVSQYLGVDHRDYIPSDSKKVLNVSDDKFGAYVRENFLGIEGKFLLYRRSFVNNNEIYCTIIRTQWSNDKNCFEFSEIYSPEYSSSSEPTNTHLGLVYISSYTGLFHFLNTEKGSVRLYTLTSSKKGSLRLTGMLQTQFISGNTFKITAVPVILEKSQQDIDDKIFPMYIKEDNSGKYKYLYCQFEELIKNNCII